MNDATDYTKTFAAKPQPLTLEQVAWITPPIQAVDTEGMTPDELVEQVKLPHHLAKNPYLQEFYGSVAWSVRGIYASYVGWFDGNPTSMFPLAAEQRASRLIDLAGGADIFLGQATNALHAGDFQWAAELSDHLIAADKHRTEAVQVKVRALSELGERQINATARNYYLTVAQFLDEKGLSKERLGCPASHHVDGKFAAVTVEPRLWGMWPRSTERDRPSVMAARSSPRRSTS